MLEDYIINFTETVQNHSSGGTKSDLNVKLFFEFISQPVVIDPEMLLYLESSV